MVNASDYRAGYPNMGDRLSIAGRSGGKSGRTGRSGRKLRGKSILDAYAKMSDKSPEKTPEKRK